MKSLILILICVGYLHPQGNTIPRRVDTLETSVDSLYTKTSHIVNVKEFDAKGDSATDDAAAIQAAITATPEGGTLIFPEGNYFTSTGFKINKPIRILGVGKDSRIRMTHPNDFQVLFYMGGSTPNGTPYPAYSNGTSYAFSGLLYKGQVQITGLNSTTGLSAGDEVFLALGVDTIDTGQNTFRMFNKIASVDNGTTVTLQIPLPEDVDSTFYPKGYAFSPVTHILHKYTTLPDGFEVGNLSIDYDDGIASDFVIGTIRAKNLYVHDIWINRSQAGASIVCGETENSVIERIYVEQGSAVDVYGSRNVSVRDVFIEDLTGTALYLETQNRQVHCENFTIQYDPSYDGTAVLFIGGHSKGVYLKGFTFIGNSVSQAVSHLTGLNENEEGDVITENFSFYGDTGAVKNFPLRQHKGILNYNGMTYSRTKHYHKTINITSALNGQTFDLVKGIIKDFKIKTRNRGTETNGVNIIQILDSETSNGSTLLDYGNTVDILPDDEVYGYLTTFTVSQIGSAYPMNDNDGLKQLKIWTAGSIPDSCQILVDIEYYYGEDDGTDGYLDSKLPTVLDETNPRMYGNAEIVKTTVNNDTTLTISNLDESFWFRDTTGNYATIDTRNITFPTNPTLVDNGTFTAWTGDDPDDWTVYNEDANNYITESSGAVNIVSGSPDATIQMAQSVCTAGEIYEYSIDVTDVTGGSIVLEGGMPVTSISTTGTHTGKFTATNPFIFVTRGALNTNVTFDNFIIRLLPRYNIIDTLNALHGVPDTTGINAGYVPKYQGDGTILWQPDISTSGSGLFNPDGVTIDTTALGAARVIPSKVTKWDSVSVKLNKADSTIYLTPSDARAEFLQISDSTIYLTPSDANTAYATKSHTHTEFYDTLAISFGIMDTVITGDYSGWKVPNNITITEISAYTNTGTVTFNIEERAETTPNTAGTDAMASDLVADTNQEEQTSFSNSTLDRNDWLVMSVTSISGDPTIFGVTIRYVKTN